MDNVILNFCVFLFFLQKALLWGQHITKLLLCHDLCNVLPLISPYVLFDLTHQMSPLVSAKCLFDLTRIIL